MEEGACIGAEDEVQVRISMVDSNGGVHGPCDIHAAVTLALFIRHVFIK